MLVSTVLGTGSRTTHATPSALVTIVPASPTAAKLFPSEATPRSNLLIGVVCVACGVQTSESALVCATPRAPTATKAAPFQAAEESAARLPGARAFQTTPSALERIVPFVPTAT